MNDVIVTKVENLEEIPTSHNIGTKRIFLTKEETKSAVTQIAFGSLSKNENVDIHAHETMEECYFFLNGAGLFKIGEKDYNVEAGTFVKVPAKVKHALVNTGDVKLDFFYFGVAID